MWQQEVRWMRHVVHAKDRELRLDRCLRYQFPSLSQSFLQTQLRKRKIRLQFSSSSDQKSRANSLLFEDSVVSIDVHLFRSKMESVAQKEQQVTRQEETLMTMEDKTKVRHLKQRLLYQDKQFVILNKPYGLAVQGGSGLKESLDRYLPSIAASLTGRHYQSQHNADEHRTLKLVHRLDMDTSGVLVLARSRLAAAKFSKLLQNGDVHKTYQALVAPSSFADNSYTSLKKFEGREIKLPVDGKSACTFVRRVLRQSDQTEPIGTWLQLQPRTGRKHQLRVHCAQVLDTPIVGDAKYGGRPADRLYLHASRIRFPDPFSTGRFQRGATRCRYLLQCIFGVEQSYCT
ncbi:unnamed protein product [Peronospora farinosa]|uniref:Pseudouridine synthase RsuA/RluA-like domain-containing protein n=1 Tax=Peronospora farinosa TaxID=134698 RepID=A0AAV0UF15_9STRA|nr:unnamed protein product [Peronospora farinosa]